MAIKEHDLTETAQMVSEHLRSTLRGSLVRPRRINRMVSVSERRLISVTLVLENVHDNHNVSAMIRSAEGFGLNDIHIVEEPVPYQVNRAILKGADRWVNIHRHERVIDCLSTLKDQGYKIAVADVGPGCVELGELPVDAPLALVMGSERDGLSMMAKDMADMRFMIPMAGFTESFNVSVSAAISLYDITMRRRRFILPAVGEHVPETIEADVSDWLVETVRLTPKIHPPKG